MILTKCEFRKEIKRLKNLYEERAATGQGCPHQSLLRLYALREAYTVILQDLEDEDALLEKVLDQMCQVEGK